MPDSDSATQNYMKTGGFVSGQFWLLSCVIGRSARKKSMLFKYGNSEIETLLSAYFVNLFIWRLKSANSTKTSKIMYFFKRSSIWFSADLYGIFLVLRAQSICFNFSFLKFFKKKKGIEQFSGIFFFASNNYSDRCRGHTFWKS